MFSIVWIKTLARYLDINVWLSIGYLFCLSQIANNYYLRKKHINFTMLLYGNLSSIRCRHPLWWGPLPSGTITKIVEVYIALQHIICLTENWHSLKRSEWTKWTDFENWAIKLTFEKVLKTYCSYYCFITQKHIIERRKW